MLPNIRCFGSFRLAVSQDYFKKWTDQKKELPVATMFVNEPGRNELSL